jgi:predicted transcriptional regulator of viral defense system
MKRSEAKIEFNKYIILSNNDFKLISSNFDRRRLYERQKKWYITQIKKWYYIQKGSIIWDIGLFMLANKIYQPSYISLESALSYYSIIPEWVFKTTSITTKTTRNYSTEIWNFDFYHIKKSLLLGYTTKQYKEYKYNIATLEKAIFDFIYLKPQYTSIEDFEWLRIDADIIKENRDKQKLIEFWKISWNKKCQKRIKNFISYIENNA